MQDESGTAPRGRPKLVTTKPTERHRHESMFLPSAASAASACVLIVLALTFEVEKGTVSAGDRQAELQVHTQTPPQLHALMTGLSYIGSSWPMAVLTLLCAALCIRQPSRWAAGFVVACSLGASLLGAALKHLVHRQRPHLWPHAAILNSYSFPSGHATISSAFFASATYVIWKGVGRGFGTVATVASVALVAGIGFSRVYLGVHWPSDVAAGYALGLAWVLSLIVLVEAWLRKALKDGIARS